MKTKLTPHEQLIRWRRRERQAQAKLAELKLRIAEGAFTTPGAIQAHHAELTGILRQELARFVEEVATAAPGITHEKDMSMSIHLAARAALTRMSEEAGRRVKPQGETR